MSKYLSPKKKHSNRKLWILLAAVLIALAVLVFAVVKIFDSTLPDEPDDPDTPDIGVQDPDTPTPPQQGGEPGDTPGPGDTPTPPEPETPSADADKIAEADRLIRGYFYDEAIALLTGLQSNEAQDKLQEAEALKAGLVKYTGQAYHIFFHSLIIDTDLAFDDKGHPASGYNEWMTTRDEFNKMLPLLLENDFVLYDITWMCEFDEATGKVKKKDIYLPEGKKPLIMSFDDMNYYDYMLTDGFAQRLDVDENGKIVTHVGGTPVKRNGHIVDIKNYEVTYDGDAVPILDAFCEEHPEFSYRGAKGIAALTGYAGAFGWRITDLDWYTKEEQEQLLDKVKLIADTMRANGWQIANHSYTHNQYWNNKTIDMEKLKYDTGRWLNEIMPYVGESHIFISPFGVSFKQDDERFRYIVEECGFYIYCPVTASMTTTFHGDNMIQERLNFDGLTMIEYPERIKRHFFDPALILDRARPPMD
jgi:hypothetical protein